MSLNGIEKKESVKNRIMSVGAAVLENTFLFPVILFSPTTFTLLHFKNQLHISTWQIYYIVV